MGAVKVRLTGTAGECAAMVAVLRQVDGVEVREVSGTYANRGDTSLVRVYVDVRVAERRLCAHPGDSEHDHEACRDVHAEILGSTDVCQCCVELEALMSQGRAIGARLEAATEGLKAVAAENRRHEARIRRELLGETGGAS